MGKYEFVTNDHDICPSQVLAFLLKVPGKSNFNGVHDDDGPDSETLQWQQQC